MIHLTVAAPMGIDSVFFSFIERLAVQNGHLCVDPPAQQLDELEPGGWIEAMRSSSQHHFVIGYRYPPAYWKVLAESASTVCLLADPDGIARQVEHINKNSTDDHVDSELRSSVEAVRHALEATIELMELILTDDVCRAGIIPHAEAFLTYPHEAFQRLERFYSHCRVSVDTPCWKSFSDEAIPLFHQIRPADQLVRREIHRLLTLEEATPQRLKAVSALFSGNA